MKLTSIKSRMFYRKALMICSVDAFIRRELRYLFSTIGEHAVLLKVESLFYDNSISVDVNISTVACFDTPLEQSLVRGADLLPDGANAWAARAASATDFTETLTVRASADAAHPIHAMPSAFPLNGGISGTTHAAIPRHESLPKHALSSQ